MRAGVGEGDGVFDGGGAEEEGDGGEELGLGDFHLWCDVHEEGWLEIVA